MLNSATLSYTPARSPALISDVDHGMEFHNHTLPRGSATFETVPVGETSHHIASASPPAQSITLPAPVAVMQSSVDPAILTIPAALQEEPATAKASGRAPLLGRCHRCIKSKKKCPHIPASAEEDEAMKSPEEQTFEEELLALVPDSSATDSADPLEPDVASPQALIVLHIPPESLLEFEKLNKLTKPKKTDGATVLCGHFIDKVTIRFRGRAKDQNALNTFDRDRELHRTNEIDDKDFYVRIYKMLARGKSLDLLPDLHKVVLYNGAELIRLKNRAELELAQEPVAPKVARKSKGKARPTNAIKGSETFELGNYLEDGEGTEEEDTADEAREATPGCDAPHDPFTKPGPSDDSEDDGPNQQDSKSKKTPSSKSKKKISSSSTAKKNRSSSTSKKTPSSDKMKKRPSGKTDRIRRSVRSKRTALGHLHSTEVPHVGPVYPDRRMVLRRESTPYVHFCGRAFPHPQDVRAHHRQAKCYAGPVSDRAWNEHPSCAVDYPDISYAKLADGYVILDQASQDRLDAAIAIGEAVTDRRGGKLARGLAEAELADDSEEELNSIAVRNGEKEMDSEQDAEFEYEFEFDEDYEYQGSKTMISTFPFSEVNRLAPMFGTTPVANPRKRAASSVVDGSVKKVILKTDNSNKESVVSGPKAILHPNGVTIAKVENHETVAFDSALKPNKRRQPPKPPVRRRGRKAPADTDGDVTMSCSTASKQVERASKVDAKTVNEVMESFGPASMASKRPVKPVRTIVKAGPD